MLIFGYLLVVHQLCHILRVACSALWQLTLLLTAQFFMFWFALTPQAFSLLDRMFTILHVLMGYFYGFNFSVCVLAQHGFFWQ